LGVDLRSGRLPPVTTSGAYPHAAPEQTHKLTAGNVVGEKDVEWAKEYRVKVRLVGSTRAGESFAGAARGYQCQEDRSGRFRSPPGGRGTRSVVVHDVHGWQSQVTAEGRSAGGVALKHGVASVGPADPSLQTPLTTLTG
jgi:hypothetical protein